MSLGKPVPILRIFDEQKAREFYVGYLGFQVDWQHRFGPDMPLYLSVSRDECILHLSEHHGDSSPGAAVRVRSRELNAYLTELAAKSYTYARPSIEAMPWGSREMSIKDPFGHRLTFHSDAPSVASADFQAQEG